MDLREGVSLGARSQRVSQSLEEVSKKSPMAFRPWGPKVRKKSRKGPTRLLRDFFETFWPRALKLPLPGPRNLKTPSSLSLSLSPSFFCFVLSFFSLSLSLSFLSLSLFFFSLSPSLSLWLSIWLSPRLSVSLSLSLSLSLYMSPCVSVFLCRAPSC